MNCLDLAMIEKTDNCWCEHGADNHERIELKTASGRAVPSIVCSIVGCHCWRKDS